MRSDDQEAPAAGRDDPGAAPRRGAAAAEVLADTLADQGPAPEPRAPLAPGTRLGRFLVVEPLGAGGMGVVVAAYDPNLDRKVALKLLRSASAAESAAAADRERLLREARAMARLAHPHVLPVHEVGTVGDQVFIAMEFAAGGTLAAWLEERPRSWREVREAFLAAGRGLAAAHAAGLVHRDFKPENVLRTREGHVRVADFGLVGVTARPRTGDLRGSLAPPPVSTTLTEAGTLLGTPAYMAPEQHAGLPVDARADQFAFCVALYEALYHVAPFAGETYPELARNVTAGRCREPPAHAHVPTYLAAVLRRGLAPRPADRFPSMEALLAALERDPASRRRRRRRTVAVTLGFVALAALSVVLFLRRGVGGDLRCEGAPHRLAGVWDPARQAAVRRAFLATGRGHAADVAAAVTRRLDAWSAAWVAARREACEATHLRGEQSGLALDLRMRCLDRRLAETRALVTLFTERPDPEILDRAGDAVARLTPLATCADTEALARAIPPPTDPATRARVETLGRHLDRVRALGGAGKYRDALTAAQAAAREAGATGYAPIAAEALLARARMEGRTGQAPAAETTLLAALKAAAQARDDRLAAETWLELVAVVGSLRARFAEGLRLATFAEAALTRAGDDPLLRATWLEQVGRIRWNQGRNDEARARYQEALALRERRLGADHPDVARTLSLLGAVARSQERYGDARRALDRAVGILERSLGRDHPDVATVLYNLGDLLEAEGKVEEAVPYHRRALAIRERAFGPSHPQVAASLEKLGEWRRRHGDYATARQYLERSVAITEKVQGPDHPSLAAALNNLGLVLKDAGHLDEAGVCYERALTIYTKALGPDHADTAIPLLNLGDIRVAQHRLAEARRDYARALAIWERRLGPDNSFVAYALTGEAEARVAQGQAAQAIPPAERALRLREGKPGDPLELARTRLVLGRALEAAGRDRARAVTLVRAARDGFAVGGPPAARSLTEATAWLARRAPGRTPGAASRTAP